MTLAHARALLHEAPPRIIPHQPEADALALDALARWATRLAPIVAIDPPDGLALDLSGCQRVIGDDRALIAHIARAAERLRLHTRIAIAPTYGAAWALARYANARRTIVDPRELKEAIDPLPVSALRLEQNEPERLAEVGVESIGQLRRIPRTQLAARFGTRLLHRLDQALGLASELLDAVRPPLVLRTDLQFDGPTTHPESIHAAVEELLARLIPQLDQHELGVRTLHAAFERSDAPAITLAFTLTRPSRDHRHLWTLLRTRLERLDPAGGIDAITLTARRTARLRTDQHSLDPDADRHRADTQQAGELLDALVDRLGRERVTRVLPHDSHLPERQFAHRTVLAPDEQTPAPVAPGMNRPSHLFDPPEPIDVIAIAPDGPPCWLRWQSREHAIVAAIGPERIGTEWWDRTDPVDDAAPVRARSYYRVQTDQADWFWICRTEPDGRWRLHGRWQ